MTTTFARHCACTVLLCAALPAGAAAMGFQSSNIAMGDFGPNWREQYGIMKFIIAITVLAASFSAQAAQSMKAEVNGMVCAFCAQGIEKKLLRPAGAAGVDRCWQGAVVAGDGGAAAGLVFGAQGSGVRVCRSDAAGVGRIAMARTQLAVSAGSATGGPLCSDAPELCAPVLAVGGDLCDGGVVRVRRAAAVGTAGWPSGPPASDADGGA